MTPAACRPSAVSWIDAIRALRYCFFIAFHLHQPSQRHNSCKRLFVVRQQFAGEFLQRDQFGLLDIVVFVLRETVNEDRPRAGPEHNQRSESAGLALAWTRDPLFDDSTAEIGGD